MSSLRFIERDGKRILQQKVKVTANWHYSSAGGTSQVDKQQLEEWEDVPTAEENKKPREFWIDDVTLRVCGPWSDVASGKMQWPDCGKVLYVSEIPVGAKVIKKDAAWKVIQNALQKGHNMNNGDPIVPAITEFMKDLGFEV